MSDTKTNHIPDILPADGFRICPRCGRTKPESAFRTPNTSLCKNCTRRGSLTGQNRRLKDALVKLAAGKIAAAARGDRLDAPRISQVCATMMGLFGGTDEFCKKWYDQITTVLTDRPGSKTALDQMSTMMKLVKESTASVDSNRYGDLSDEELNAVIDAKLAEVASALPDDPLDDECIDDVPLLEDCDLEVYDG